MISLGFKNGKIVAAITQESQDKFGVCVSVLKNQKFKWNAKEQQWEKSAIFYTDDLFDILSIATKVYFPESAKEAIKSYPDLMPTELIIKDPIEKIDYEKYSNFKPVVGKPPFENYQDEDIKAALRQNRFLFNWTMGLGKSYATSIIYEYQKDKANCGKMFLFTTKIGTYNLKSELLKFCKSLKDEDIEVFNSTKSFKKYGRKIFDDEEINKKKVLVFSYDSWKLIANSYGDKKQGKILNIPLKNFFQNYEPLLCLDECHQLSNPKSERSRSLFKYLNFFKYRYLFSATPADKNEKIYSIARILDPKLVFFLKYSDWLEKYNDIGTWFSKYAINKKGWHEEELKELNEKMSAYAAKRDAAKVLNLPDCIFVNPFMIPMSEKQTALYREVTNDVVNNILQKNPDMSSSSVDLVKEAFGTVMSLVENPIVLGSGENKNVSEPLKEKCRKYDFQKDYAKLEVVDAILEDEVDDKENRGIIWYIHPLTKDALLERYKNYNPILITSEMDDEERFKKVEEFKKDKSHKVLIASEYILSTSVTLIECTFAVYLETAFSFETYKQSTGRIYRIGQKEKVRIYHIYYENTVDTFHMTSLASKKDLTDFLFSKKKPILSLTQIKKMFTGQSFD